MSMVLLTLFATTTGREASLYLDYKLSPDELPATKAGGMKAVNTVITTNTLVHIKN